ncbi:MAG TPA: cytochrome P450, partial [Dehalococcoidia bacterium]|nr:cytochrome P450 [Dehalococcoidia bacterium]
MKNGYNPLSEEVWAEPSIGYRHLLEEEPVHFFEAFDPPFYTLSRFADVQAALLDIETYSSEWGQGPRFSPPGGMLSNPPQHTFYRGLVQQAFTPRAIAEWGERITALSEELLDQRTGTQAWDLHDDYA